MAHRFIINYRQDKSPPQLTYKEAVQSIQSPKYIPKHNNFRTTGYSPHAAPVQYRRNADFAATQGVFSSISNSQLPAIALRGKSKNQQQQSINHFDVLKTNLAQKKDLTFHRKRNSEHPHQGRVYVDPLDVERIPLVPGDVPSFNLTYNNPGLKYMKNQPDRKSKRFQYISPFNKREEVSKGHPERSVKQGIHDPFKLHFLSFESTFQETQASQMFRTQSKASWLQTDRSQQDGKFQLYDEYEEKYGIKVSQKKKSIMNQQLDLRGVQLVMGKKLAMKKQANAAIVIQKRWRGYACLKWYRGVNAVRDSVASRFQRVWRKYFVRVIIVQREVKKWNRSARLVQRCLKGFLGRKSALVTMSANKIEATYQYFQKIKRDMETDAVIKIVYRMRKYAKKKAAKRKKAADKKKADAGKKKGKYGGYTNTRTSVKKTEPATPVKKPGDISASSATPSKAPVAPAPARASTIVSPGAAATLAAEPRPPSIDSINTEMTGVEAALLAQQQDAGTEANAGHRGTMDSNDLDAALIDVENVDGQNLDQINEESPGGSESPDKIEDQSEGGEDKSQFVTTMVSGLGVGALDQINEEADRESERPEENQDSQLKQTPSAELLEAQATGDLREESKEVVPGELVNITIDSRGSQVKDYKEEKTKE